MNRELTQDEIMEMFGKEASTNLIALQNGEIDFAEYSRRNYKIRQNIFAPELIDHALNGKWQEFVDMALGVYEVMPIAFDFFEDVPDDMKYDFAINAYIHHGDSIPAVRKAVRNALKWGRPELPDELSNAKEITVYRAGEEPINKAKYRISWTTSKDVALFFLNTYRGRHANYLYEGKIRPEHIIAYTDERQEKEVMQYGKVYDIKDITLQVDEVLRSCAEELQ